MDQRTRLTHLEVKHIDQEFIIEKNKYNMKSVITFAFLILFQMVFSQIKGNDKVELEISKLITAKHQYEKIKGYAAKRPEIYNRQKDSCYNSYIGYIKELKSNSNEYKQYIDNAIKSDELEKELLFYTYVNKNMPFDPNKYTISKLDLYRVINHYLFVLNKNVLPENLEDIHISIKKNRKKGFKHQTEKDIVTEIRRK